MFINKLLLTWINEQKNDFNRKSYCTVYILLPELPPNVSILWKHVYRTIYRIYLTSFLNKQYIYKYLYIETLSLSINKVYLLLNLVSVTSGAHLASIEKVTSLYQWLDCTSWKINSYFFQLLFIKKILLKWKNEQKNDFLRKSY